MRPASTTSWATPRRSPIPPWSTTSSRTAGSPEALTGHRAEASAEVVALSVPVEVDAAPFLAVLDDQERARAGRFTQERDRLRFVVAHGLLRVVLGRSLGVPPGDLRFQAEAYGRPRLEPDGLAFSLAHSGDEALVAIQRDGDIGVDVEAHRPLPYLDRLLGMVATAEERAELDELAAAERMTAFFDLWTRKEALAKATGLGLSLPLTATATPAGVTRLKGRAFRIDQLPLRSGLSAALARSPADAWKVEVRCLAFADLQAALEEARDKRP